MYPQIVAVNTLSYETKTYDNLWKDTLELKNLLFCHAYIRNSCLKIVNM